MYFLKLTLLKVVKENKNKLFAKGSNAYTFTPT